MAKKKTTTQKQKQKQSVIVNINTSNTKPRRKYTRKPKGSNDNNNHLKPPQHPQMIIHQQAFAPQPLIQNPTPQQFIPQVQPSALHQSAVESQNQAQQPRGNGLERPPPPPPRLPTPPPSEDNTHPFSANEPRKRENKKMTHY